jgi:hypothetical protein
MASLCTISEGDYASSPGEEIFTAAERKLVRDLTKLEHGDGATCTTPLYFGLFFDGTKNNYELNESTKSQSNVARLYDTFPGNSVQGVLPSTANWTTEASKYRHFFRVYAPGVASPFKEVNNTGAGTSGAVAGVGGQERIIWMLVQAINNVHRFFMNDAPLVTPDETKSLIRKITLNRDSLDEMRPLAYLEGFSRKGKTKAEQPRVEFEMILQRLHKAVRLHWVDKKTKKPLKKEPGIVTEIRVSVFGFSRGATQARAFANWFKALCALDASLCSASTDQTLGGFPVSFDFLGLFDTVASVGLGNTLGNSIFGHGLDGHAWWADTEKSLRVPSGIKKCVHLIAAHEVRRSFPVDSISVGSALPPACKEIVFPGVHSDVGCGYAPGEQGRGTDPFGADMLPRIPLITMYKEAKLAGVPLHLEMAPQKVQDKFKVDPKVIAGLKAYLDNCKVKAGPLTDIMREQGKLHILWHRNRLPNAPMPIDATASFKRATNFDKNDLHSAHLEMVEEVRLFEEWRRGKGKNFKPAHQEPGFDDGHANEWEEISTWWDKDKTAPDAVLNFFDEFVHDSRAWFKLSGADNEKDLRDDLQEKVETRKRIRLYNERNRKQWAGGGYAAQRLQPPPMSDGFTPEENRILDEFERTGQIPRMVNEGREGYSMYGFAVRAGYLRYRKVYAGGDSTLLSRAAPEAVGDTELA